MTNLWLKLKIWFLIYGLLNGHIIFTDIFYGQTHAYAIKLLTKSPFVHVSTFVYDYSGQYLHFVWPFTTWRWPVSRIWPCRPKSGLRLNRDQIKFISKKFDNFVSHEMFSYVLCLLSAQMIHWFRKIPVCSFPLAFYLFMFYRCKLIILILHLVSVPPRHVQRYAGHQFRVDYHSGYFFIFYLTKL